MRYLLIILAFAAIGFSACDDLVDPQDVHVTLLTDRDEYVATYISGEGAYSHYGFTVVARVQNHSPDPIYLARCYPESPHPIFGIELVDRSDPWGAAYDRVWACVGHDQDIRLRPGEVRIDTLQIGGPNAVAHVSQEPLGTLSGNMRLRYQVQSCRGDGDCLLPGDIGASNLFTVSLDTNR
jgi:hypothetical protein